VLTLERARDARLRVAAVRVQTAYRGYRARQWWRRTRALLVTLQKRYRRKVRLMAPCFSVSTCACA
jgi:RecB family exonuclease